MTVWVLTEGWYADTEIKGVTSSEDTAREWESSDLYRDAEECILDGVIED